MTSEMIQIRMVSWTDACVPREIWEVAVIEQTLLIGGDAITD